MRAGPFLDRYALSGFSLAPIEPEDARRIATEMVKMDPWLTMNYSVAPLESYLSTSSPALHRYAIEVDGATAGVVTVQNLTITNGTDIDSGDVANGGGVAVDDGATLSFTDCAVTNNTAVHDGGGLYNAGTTTVSGCSVTGNTAR